MRTQTLIRVLVADDHAVVREGIRQVLSGEHGFEVVGEASSGPEAVARAEALRPDVVLLDISMPGGTGLDATPELLRRLPQTRILVLSVHDSEEYVLQCVRAGAHGYLLKDSSPTQLRDAVRAVHSGDAFFSAVVARRLSELLRADTPGAPRASRLDALTPREREVLGGIAIGETNKAIGARLGISPRTVETHRESLMRKLEIRTVAGLTRIAVEEGLVAD